MGRRIGAIRANLCVICAYPPSDTELHLEPKRPPNQRMARAVCHSALECQSSSPGSYIPCILRFRTWFRMLQRTLKMSGIEMEGIFLSEDKDQLSIMGRVEKPK